MSDPLEKIPSALLVRELHVRAVRETSREADFVASTDAIDSYGEIVDQSWILDRYLKNPVVLWAHQSRELPIGQCTRVAMVDGSLECTIRFASEKANPKAEQVWQGYLEKTIRAVSVGFNPQTMRYEMRDGVEVCVCADNVLYEISCTPIGANEEALAKAKQKALAEMRSKAPLPPTSQISPSAERDGKEKDPNMDEKQIEALRMKNAELELQAKQTNLSLATLETKVATLTTERDGAATAVKALETQNARLVIERDAEKAAREKSDSELIEIEVGALVGKKISAAEKPEFVELRKTNKPLFERMVAQRSEMTHTKTESVLGEEPKPAPSTTRGADDLSDLNAEFLKDAEKAA